jgi:hypothetical protein
MDESWFRWALGVSEMRYRFGKFSIDLVPYPLPDWSLQLSYWDGGLAFVFFRWEMRWDWGYYESKWGTEKITEFGVYES